MAGDNVTIVSKEEKEQKKKKKCFIITPIGDDNSEIRRHTDGIIDECISPVLEGKYEIDVSHRNANSGSITKQIVNGIYDADIAIANLTGLNPNVMYELAFRHAIKKPVIVIAEKGTKIPFDISDERTIMYTNDIKGALELKKELRERLSKVETIAEDDVDNPIYNFLELDASMQTVMKDIKTEADKNAFEYIMQRLDSMESMIRTQLRRNSSSYRRIFEWTVSTDDIDSSTKAANFIGSRRGEFFGLSISIAEDTVVKVLFNIANTIQERRMKNLMNELVEQQGIISAATEQIY